MADIKRSIYSTALRSVVPLVLAALVSGEGLFALPPGLGPLVQVYQNPAAIAPNTTGQPPTTRPQVRVVENGESKTKPDDCRGIIVGPGINQPDPFPGYGGFVGWESPIRLQNGDWLVDSRHA
jgi:hypothetical protein